MSVFSDYPIALGVVQFLQGDIVYSAADYEPIKAWLEQIGLLPLVENPLASVGEEPDSTMVRWYYNDARAQVLFALLRTLPVEVVDTATDEQLTAFVKVLQLQRTYLEDCCTMVEQVVQLTADVAYRRKEDHKQMLEAWRLELASIESLLSVWGERLPWLRESERDTLFNELAQRWSVDDAVFLYKQGLSDELLSHPLFESCVGAELQQLESVPLQIRPIIGRVVRVCQAMEADGTPAHAELMARVDGRLKALDIQLTEGERLFCAKPTAYRQAFKALRSGELKLDQVDQSLWDDALVDVSLLTDWSQIKTLKKPWLTQLRCEHAIALCDVQLLQYVPYEFQSAEMLDVALMEEVELVRYANPDCLTLDMAYRVAGTKGQLLRYLPARLITDKVAEKALRQNIAAWPFIPEEKRSVRVCQVAVEVDPNCLSQVPVDKRTVEVCLTAVAKEPKVARFIPETVWNDQQFWCKVREMGLTIIR